MTTRVGFIGLGNMGKPMAINLAKAGFDLMVYDLRAEPMQELAALGAKCARSADEIGRHAEMIELVVVDDAQVEAVTYGEGGVLASARPGTVIAVHSTVHPRTVRHLADLAKIKGITVIDAEVSGGERGAYAKTLCYMVGGDKRAFEKCRPLFATSGSSIFHLGELGAGAITKLAHNLIVYVNMLAAAEGMKLAQTAGVDLAAMEQVVHAGAAQSRIADHWSHQRRLGATYTTGPQGLMQLIHKDLRLALELGHDVGLSLPGAALTQQLIARILEIDGR
ncbi:MAG TPA: NAD(P)-dependent oxidoreductase [Candidatus Binataceae bacterium]|nr:NAD(P)-dependent oxidoreductase [Candidatus Binataceae bacterium]